MEKLKPVAEEEAEGGLDLQAPKTECMADGHHPCAVGLLARKEVPELWQEKWSLFLENKKRC